jgi:ABC-type branched-subunit amino acid transport system permease subunit
VSWRQLVDDHEATLAPAAALVVALAAFLAWQGATLATVLLAVLALATFAVGQLENRDQPPVRWVWWGLLALDAGLVYAWVTRAGWATAVVFPLAIGVVALGWWIEERRDTNNMARLGALVLATLILLAGQGWSGAVPWQSLTFTLITILTFAVFAVGLNLEYGFGGLINFGHVAFMAIGAYTVALLAELGGFWATQTGILAAFGLALVVAALAGLLLALPAIRLREDYLAIVTIAFAEILRRVMLNEGELTHGAHGVTVSSGRRPLVIDALESIPLVGPQVVAGLDRVAAAMDFTGSPYLFILFLIAVAITVVLLWLAERLVESPWGRLVEAIREDEDAVRSLGGNPTVYKLQVFAFGSAVAAAAGALWAWQLTFVVPQHFAPLRTFWGWMMIVIGGVANTKGAIAGAFLFWTIWSLTRGLSFLRGYGLDGGQIAAISPMVLGLMFVGFMLLKPEGLFGDKEELELVE